MDKTTIRLIRFTCIFIISGGIFGALWRVSYVKNIEKQEEQELRDELNSFNYGRYMGLCLKKNKYSIENWAKQSSSFDWFNYCEESWEKRLKDLGDDAYNLDDYESSIPTDKKLETDF